MTHQQELELLAEWMGLKGEWRDLISSRIAEFKTIKHTKRRAFMVNSKEWNPSPTGNPDDFLNMVAGRVWIRGNDTEFYVHTTDGQHDCREYVKDHHNDKLAAMKHAAYQVCLMAAKEWKEEVK